MRRNGLVLTLAVWIATSCHAAMRSTQSTPPTPEAPEAPAPHVKEAAPAGAKAHGTAAKKKPAKRTQGKKKR